MGEIVKLADERARRDQDADDAFHAYAAAKRRTDMTLELSDAREAARHWKRFLELICGRGYLMSAAPAAVINIEAEQALIGACLVNSDVLDVIDGIVRPEDFSEPAHVEVFDAFLRARIEGRRVDVNLARSALGAVAGAMIAEGMNVGQYLARLAADATTVVNAPDYARIIAETANYRRLMAAGDELRAKASAGYLAGKPASLASDAITQLDAIAASGAGRRTRVSLAEASKAASDDAEDASQHGVVHGLSTGVADLDRVARFHPGEMTILAARPSMGKTTVGLAIALNVAKAGEGVLFFSLEMSAGSLAQRALSAMCFDGWQAPIPYTDIRDGKLPEGGMDRIRDADATLASLPMLIEDQAGLTASQIAARAKTGKQWLEKKGHRLGLIVVDHLGLIASTDRYAGARHLELGATTTSLRSLAKELGVPLLLLCQLSRGLEGRENKRPMLSDLRESGRIEEDADAVMLLYRESYYLERAKETDADKEMARLEKMMACQNVLEINVAKQRQGATRTVECFVSMPNNALRNLSRGGMQ